MNRQAFKQRMQNLKSYRENNPGKGYWDWKVEAFADGGQTGDPEKERFYQATGRSSSGRPLEVGKPSKYRPFSEVEHMFPDKDRAKSVYEYLRKPTEKKSIMNQFDEYLMNTLTPSTYPTNTKQFRQVIESAPDLYNNMKMLLKIHTKPSVLYKDFLTRPLVNKINKNKNQEIV